MKPARGRIAAAIAASLALAAFLPAATRSPGIEVYWPHLPGASWSYDRVELQWGAAAKSSFTTIRFTLGDSTVVGAGISVQPLDVDVSGTVAAVGSTFWRQLSIARPDLRLHIAAPERIAAGSGLVIHDATLLRVAADEVAAYRSTPSIRSWIYIEPDVTPGHMFRLQLVPDLADSVYLDGTVVGRADVTTPAGSYAAALRIRYDVDYGWADVLDDQGATLGRIRSRTRGEMFYAPEVGPVLAREIFVPYAEVEGSPPPSTVDSTFAELRLVSYALEPSAAHSRSWTEMKRAYR